MKKLLLRPIFIALLFLSAFATGAFAADGPIPLKTKKAKYADGDNADLRNLYTSDGWVWPVVTKDVTETNLITYSYLEQLSLTPVLQDPNAHAVISYQSPDGGISVPHNTESAPFAIEKLVASKFYIKVTSANGLVKKTYIVNLPVLHTITNMEVGPGGSAPAFDPANFNYHIDVPPDRSSLEVTISQLQNTRWVLEGHKMSPLTSRSSLIWTARQLDLGDNFYTLRTYPLNGPLTADRVLETYHFTIRRSPPLTVSATHTDIAGENDPVNYTGRPGTATAVPNGGTAPYTYSWFNVSTNTALSQTTAAVDGLNGYKYKVTVTDFYGATDTTSVTIKQTVPFILILPTCPDLNDGIFEPGGLPGVGFNINGEGLYVSGTTPAKLTNIPSSWVYGVTVGTEYYELYPPTKQSLTIEVFRKKDVTTYGGNDGGIFVNPKYADGNYAFTTLAWFDLSTNTQIAVTELTNHGVTGLKAGTYRVISTEPDICPVSLDITITQPKSTNANLSNLVVSSGALSPVFNTNTIGYAVLVSGSTASINISAIADPEATITYNSQTYVSGSLVGVALNPGENIVPLLITAGNGATKTYTLTITRLINPTINYGSSAALVIKQPISPITPTSSNVAAFGYNTQSQVIGSGLFLPYSVAVDAVGTVYASDFNGGVIHKFNANGSIELINSGYDYAVVAIDRLGNMYAAFALGNQVLKYAGGTGSPTVVPTYGVSGINSIGFDASNNMYLLDVYGQRVYKLPVNGGAPVQIAGNYPNATTIAVDDNGDVYVTGETTGKVYKLPAGSNTPIEVGVFGTRVSGVHIDRSHNVFTLEADINTLKMIPATNQTTATTIATNVNVGYGLTGDAEGNLYVARVDEYATGIDKYKPTGGYFIDKALPAGLTFDSNTGVISGTPTVSSPATTYQVTAYNGPGKTTANVTIEVISNNADLSALTLSAGTLTPAFNKDSLTYNVDVTAKTATIAITAFAADTTATITVNGTTVASGATSGNIALVAGDNTITVNVLAQDGLTAKTYIVTVTRAQASGNTSVKLAITPLENLIEYSGGPANVNYKVSANPSITRVQLSAQPQKEGTTVIVNGMTLSAPGYTADPVDLAGDTTYIYVTAIAANGSVRTYSVMVTTRDYNDNVLFDTDSETALKKATAGPASVNYTTVVSNATNTIKIHATPDNPAAIVTIAGKVVTSGSSSVRLNSVGSTIIPITSSSDGGLTTISYSITVTKKASNDATAEFALNNGSVLQKAVSGPAGKNYFTSVSPSTTSVKVTPTTTDPNATVTINGIAVANKTASSAITLSGDTTLISIVVTAEDGIKVKTYSIAVAKNGSNVATATFATNTTANLAKTSGPAKTNYAISVNSSLTTLAVTPKLTDARASVTIDGAPATNGVASRITLNASGTTLISMLVTAQDGVTTQSYSILVSRSGSNNAEVALSMNPKTTLTKVTGSPRTYQTLVNATTTAVRVVTKPEDARATITLNGAPASTSNTGTAVTLTGDTTMANITSVAENGVSTKTYSIAIIKKAPMTLFAAAGDSRKDIIADQLIQAKSPITDVTGTTKGVTIYPNPFIDQLKIDLKGYNAKEAHITITTLQAREMFNQKLPVNDNKVELNVSDLKQGIYIINISVNGERKGYRIVKN